MTDLKVVELGNAPKEDIVPEKVLEVMETARKELEKIGVTDSLMVILAGEGHIVDTYSANKDSYLLLGALEAIKQELTLSILAARQEDEL